MKRTFHACLLTVAASALLSVGCKGKSDAPSAAPAAKAAPAAATPAAPAPSPAPAATATPTPAPAAQPAQAQTEPAAPPEDPEGHRNWNCGKACKLAVDRTSTRDYKAVDECEFDCKNMASDKNGRFLRGALAGAPFYTCIDKAGDCAGITKCDHLFDAP